MTEHHPAGPVHVLAEHLLDGTHLWTLCGLAAGGVLWNLRGGPTSCQDCLEALAEEVERALVPVLHRFQSFRDGSWTCRACDVAYRRSLKI